MTKYIWLDGQFVEWEKATVHVLSHALMYGTSIFEGIRSYDVKGKTGILSLERHLKRFFHSAKIYRLDVPYTLEELSEAVKATLRKNHMKVAYIRPMAFKGYNGTVAMSHDKFPLHVSIACIEQNQSLVPGDYLRAMVSSWARPANNTTPTYAKAASNYMLSQLVSMEAVENGVDIALCLNADGYVSEGPGQNVFAVRNGILYTPDISSGILLGITRDIVLEIAKDLDLPAVETKLTRDFLYCCDEIFLSGTATEVKPVVEIDRLPVGDGKPGPVGKKISDAFQEIVRGEYKRNYLDFV